MNYDLLWQMAAVVFLYMNIMFVLALLLKRNDIVDVAWGMGFVVLAVFMLGREQGYHWRRLLLSALVFVWGLRLSIYLYLRNKGKKEDFRYAKWRKDWGKHWVIRSYLQSVYHPRLLHGAGGISTHHYHWRPIAYCEAGRLFGLGFVAAGLFLRGSGGCTIDALQE